MHCSHIQYNSKAPDEFSHPPQGHYAPLKWNTRRCHNVFTKLGGTWLCGHLFSPPANRNEPDQTNARWWLCIHWASAHVHVCTYNLFTPTRKLVRSGIIGKTNLLDRYYGEGVPFAVCLLRGEGRQLSRYAALIAAGHWLNDPPTLSFSCHHYNDETERQR